MNFDAPAGANPINKLKVVGHALDRTDGPLKVSGMATYTHEQHNVVANQAHHYIVGAPTVKGRIRVTNLAVACAGTVFAVWY